MDGREKVLIPEGKIGDQAKIDVPHDWMAMMPFHIYNIHARFGHLIAGTTAGRLHLAGIYASGSCAVSDRRMGKPGTVIASELVRQSWKNEPLDGAELSKLKEVSSHSNLSCTLRLSCSWLWTSSNSVAFLHNCDEIEKHPELDLNSLALEEYNHSVYAPRLMPGEELFLLGWRHSAQGAPSPKKDSGTIRYVRGIEKELRSKFVAEKPSGVPRSFPLNRPSSCSGLELKVYDEMERSYEKYHLLCQRMIGLFDRSHVRDTMIKVRKRRKKLESDLLNILDNGDESNNHLLSQLSGRTGMTAALDILCVVGGHSVCYSPCASRTSQKLLRQKGVDWAVHCVLEDKLGRILAIDADVDPHSLLAELECVREWNPVEHPRWLVFEVEQNLQIRPNQYSIVRQLLKRPGSAIQLNMGLGAYSKRKEIRGLHTFMNLTRAFSLYRVFSMAQVKLAFLSQC
jgi:hypothetical protein